MLSNLKYIILRITKFDFFDQAKEKVTNVPAEKLF
jgi:ATP/ADP translocase